MNKKRILFICKKRVDSYGISFGLLNSATFIKNALKKKDISAKVVCVEDNNGIDKEVYDFKPTHVIIHALWVIPSKFQILMRKYPTIKWIVRIHSQLPFLANEGIAFDWIYQYNRISESNKNFILSGNHKEFNEDIISLGIKSIYLPNIYCPLRQSKLKKPKDNCLNISCFGALRPMKNHLIQAVAAINYADSHKKKLRFHINGNRIEQKGDQPLRNMRAIFDNSKHELIEHDWMNHDDFIELTKEMDIGLQISLSESFNIVTADSVNNKVPVVVSDEIDWLPGWTKAEATSTDSIARKIDSNLFWNKVTFGLLTTINNFYLNCYNRKALKVWLRYLKN
jgi:hypothetical protein